MCTEPKRANHAFPVVLVVPALHHLTADFGQEKAVSVQGLDAAAVQNKLKELVKAGESMPK